MVMNTGFKSQCLPTYRVLTQEQIKHLHCATLAVSNGALFPGKVPARILPPVRGRCQTFPVTEDRK